MIAPGAVFSSGRVTITVGAGQTPDRIVQGIGRMNDGSLAVDSNAPTGSNYCGGFRMSAAGAIYGTTSTAGSDVWVQGVRTSSAGQLIYQNAAAVTFQNGNPQTASGLFAVLVGIVTVSLLLTEASDFLVTEAGDHIEVES